MNRHRVRSVVACPVTIRTESYSIEYRVRAAFTQRYKVMHFQKRKSMAIDERGLLITLAANACGSIEDPRFHSWIPQYRRGGNLYSFRFCLSQRRRSQSVASK